LAYFSRPGENYWNGGRRNLKVGNTEVLARAIGVRLNCDVHRIEAADPYPVDYDETVERNVQEQDTDARPEIANPLASIDEYDTILLASPIWNVRAPMIMTTFAERYDFAGKTVHPITTYAMAASARPPRTTRGNAGAHASPQASRFAASRHAQPARTSTHGCAAGKALDAGARGGVDDRAAARARARERQRRGAADAARRIGDERDPSRELPVLFARGRGH
jgi:flavodoxin